MNTISQQAEQLFSAMQLVRRDLHRHPELGFCEFRTAAIISKELREIGLVVQEKIAETGVVGLLESGKAGPVILLRFDMDALPIAEETRAEYASENYGVMHACGHDGHVAIGLAVARLLQRNKDQFKGTVKFMFQPAEEGLGGAARMIEEGMLLNPEVDFAMGIHLWNNLPVGQVGISAGPVMAGADIFSIQVQGRGGHGAMPDQTADPVLAAAHIITGLQSIVSRNVDPLKSAVVSVTQVHAGDAFNVIPATAEIKGTIRTFETDVRERVMSRFGTLVDGTANAFGCNLKMDVKQITPALVNDPGITRLVNKVAAEWFPDVHVVDHLQTMGSEDMAFVLQRINGCYLFLGSANQEKDLAYGHHHPRFDFDERVMPRGAALLALSAIEILNRE